MNAQFDTIGHPLGDTQQFDAITELFSILDINRVELVDAFDVRLVELDGNTESQSGHDRDLVSGVVAFNIESRIGFGVAECLRFFQNRIEIQSLSRISERMKLVVPLMMPAIHSIRLAVSPSRKALMIGMPPATAASKATMTFFS